MLPIANMKNKMNLKQRIIILIVATTLVSVLINYYITIVFSKKDIEEKTVTLISNTIEQIARNIDDSILKQTYNISNMLVYDTSIFDILKTKYPDSDDGNYKKTLDEMKLSNELLQKYLSVISDVKIAAIIGKNGVLYNINFPPTEDIDTVYAKVKDMADTSKNMVGAVQWYPLQKNYFTRSPAVNIREQYIVIASKSVFLPFTQEYVGTCIFTIDESAIYSKYSNITIGKSGRIFIIDKDGNIISANNTEELGIENSDRNLTDKIISNKNKYLKYRKNGEDVLVVSYQSKVNNWITVGTIPLNQALGEVNRIYNYVLLISVFIAAIAITIATIISDRVVKPIRTVVGAMSEVEKGNLDVSVNIKGEYEVSKLGRYFNSMILQIRQLLRDQYELGKKVKQSELDVLMSQINPHFLYNTLDSIAWMAQSGSASEASEMTMALAKMLRVGISREEEMIVTVNEEIQHVKAYMDIQKFRYKNRFDFFIELSSEYLTSFKTLKFILQPIAENAVFYGMGATKRKITIKIKITTVEDRLIFEICDNGAGMPPERLIEINRRFDRKEDLEEILCENKSYKQNGIGLKNINDRIKLYFGEEYGITVNSIEQQGTKVLVNLPIICDSN